jgi:hypothetical protein
VHVVWAKIHHLDQAPHNHIWTWHTWWEQCQRKVQRRVERQAASPPTIIKVDCCIFLMWLPPGSATRQTLPSSLSMLSTIPAILLAQSKLEQYTLQYQADDDCLPPPLLLIALHDPASRAIATMPSLPGAGPATAALVRQTLELETKPVDMSIQSKRIIANATSSKMDGITWLSSLESSL